MLLLTGVAFTVIPSIAVGLGVLIPYLHHKLIVKRYQERGF
jgi:hypothetical protein